MALQGIINGSVTNKSNYFSFYISWSAVQNIAENYSDVTVKTYWSTSNTAHKFNTVYKRNASITINGETTSISKVFNVGDWESNPYLIQSVTERVYHNNDGTKSIKISARANGRADTYGPSLTTESKDDCTASETITLNAIPRSSSFGTITGNTIGQSMTVNINSNSSSFTHSLWYKLGNSDWYSAGTNIEESKTFTLDADLISQLPNSTSGTLKLRMQTYNGTKTVGDYVYKDVTVYISDANNPTVGELSLKPQEINGNDILVQGKNKLDISVSDCAAGDGSTIKSYTFTGPGISTTTTSTSVTSGVISQAGTLKYTAIVTDARGNYTPITKQIVCHKYSAPRFKKFTSCRCTADKDTSKTGIEQFTNVVENDNGTYIKCEYTVVYSYVNNTNGVADTNGIAVYGGTSNAIYSGWSEKSKTEDFDGLVIISGYAIIENCSIDKTYSMYAIFTDKYGGKISSSKSKTPGAFKVMNVRAAGNGIAFGKMSETERVLDSAWPIKTDDPANTMQNLSYRTPDNSIKQNSDDTLENWLKQGNLATVMYNDLSIVNGNTAHGRAFVLNLSSSTSDIGLSTTKHVHQIMACQNTDQNLQDLYHRCGTKGILTSKLDPWKKILDESNYESVMDTYIKDYVVEQNTVSVTDPSCTWTYRKWKSGLIECFGAHNISDHPCGSEIIKEIFYQHNIILPNFPNGLFTNTPNVLITWQGAQSVTNFGVTGSSKDKCGSVLLCRFNNASITGKIVIEARNK